MRPRARLGLGRRRLRLTTCVGHKGLRAWTRVTVTRKGPESVDRERGLRSWAIRVIPQTAALPDEPKPRPCPPCPAAGAWLITG